MKENMKTTVWGFGFRVGSAGIEKNMQNTMVKNQLEKGCLMFRSSVVGLWERKRKWKLLLYVGCVGAPIGIPP